MISFFFCFIFWLTFILLLASLQQLLSLFWDPVQNELRNPYEYYICFQTCSVYIVFFSCSCIFLLFGKYVLGIYMGETLLWNYENDRRIWNSSTHSFYKFYNVSLLHKKFMSAIEEFPSIKQNLLKSIVWGSRFYYLISYFLHISWIMRSLTCFLESFVYNKVRWFLEVVWIGL